MQALDVQPFCLPERLPILFRQGDVPLSPAAVKKTLLACGLGLDSKKFVLQEIRLFAAARFLRWVEGFEYDEISALIHEGNHSYDGAEGQSIDAVAQWYRSEVDSRKSKIEMATLFSISLKTVTRTVWVCDLPSRRQLYGDADCRAFAMARFAIEQLKLTYFQARAYFIGDCDLDWLVQQFDDSYLTKQQLANLYGLSLLTVRATLKACGLPTDKRAYSSADVAIFERARYLLEEGGLQYTDVQTSINIYY